MSSSHPLTVGDADDEDLDDICPVCDGECTCRPKPRPVYPIPSSHVGGISSANMRAPTAPVHSPPSAMQSLKIKFTAGMLSKARAAQKIKSDDAETSSPFSAQPFFAQPVASGSGPPKKRGRPPKGPRTKAIVGSDLEEDLMSLGPYRLPKRKEPASRAKTKPKAKIVKPVKGKGMTGKKGKSSATQTASHKKNTAASDDEFGGSDLTDLDGIDDDEESMRYPTFMSASALSTSTFSSDDSDSSISDIDTDSSMEAEEENYILAEEKRNEKARVRRELLGDEGAKRKPPHNNWVIKSRKQSVGLSDADMDVDSDATEDEEEEDEEDEGIEEDETDENALSTYAGVATGWSEEEEDDGEESGFDAELFFANLSDSTEDSDSSGEGGAADADQTDVDTDMTDSFHAARLQMDNLPFEVSQGWDGQIMFSNGLREGQGVLDLDFEVSVAQLVEDSASPTQEETDVEMQTSEGEDDGEYESIGDGEVSDGGDTTDDDYVDADGLPTKRMLELFRWPSSLSAIDPMSTVSPTVSPSPLNRRHRGSFGSGSLDAGSPRPADILAGKVFWDETGSDGRNLTPDASVISSPRGTPIMGKFEAAESPRRAILTGVNKDVPSPFPRTRQRRRGSSLSSSVCLIFLNCLTCVFILIAIRWTTEAVHLHAPTPCPSLRLPWPCNPWPCRPCPPPPKSTFLRIMLSPKASIFTMSSTLHFWTLTPPSSQHSRAPPPVRESPGARTACRAGTRCRWAPSAALARAARSSATAPPLRGRPRRRVLPPPTHSPRRAAAVTTIIAY